MLVAYRDGELARRRAGKMSAHIERCAECRREIERLEAEFEHLVSIEASTPLEKPRLEQGLATLHKKLQCSIQRIRWTQWDHVATHQIRRHHHGPQIRQPAGQVYLVQADHAEQARPSSISDRQGHAGCAGQAFDDGIQIISRMQNSNTLVRSQELFHLQALEDLTYIVALVGRRTRTSLNLRTINGILIGKQERQGAHPQSGQQEVVIAGHFADHHQRGEGVLAAAAKKPAMPTMMKLAGCGTKGCHSQCKKIPRRLRTAPDDH